MKQQEKSRLKQKFELGEECYYFANGGIEKGKIVKAELDYNEQTDIEIILYSVINIEELSERDATQEELFKAFEDAKEYLLELQMKKLEEIKNMKER